MKMISSGATHEIQCRSDTTTYFVGGNIYLLTAPKVIFTYNNPHTDYATATVFWNNDPFLDTIGVYNFWSADALLGGKPYEHLSILNLDDQYQTLVTFYSGSPVYFRRSYMNTINPFVFSSEPNKFGVFDTILFEHHFITNIDNKEVVLPIIPIYYTIEGKEIDRITSPGIYLRRRGSQIDKIIVPKK